MSKRQKESSTNAGPPAVMLVNPYYAVTLSPGLFGDHPPLASEDDWVRTNAKLIEQLGAEAYLRQLLAVLKGDFPDNGEAK